MTESFGNIWLLGAWVCFACFVLQECGHCAPWFCGHKSPMPPLHCASFSWKHPTLFSGEIVPILPLQQVKKNLWKDLRKKNITFTWQFFVPFLGWLSDPWKGESWPPTMGINRSLWITWRFWYFPTPSYTNQSILCSKRQVEVSTLKAP